MQDRKKPPDFTQKPAIRAMRRAAKPGFAYANGRTAKQDYAKASEFTPKPAVRVTAADAQ